MADSESSDNSSPAGSRTGPESSSAETIFEAQGDIHVSHEGAMSLYEALKVSFEVQLSDTVESPTENVMSVIESVLSNVEKLSLERVLLGNARSTVAGQILENGVPPREP